MSGSDSTSTCRKSRREIAEYATSSRSRHDCSPFEYSDPLLSWAKAGIENKRINTKVLTTKLARAPPYLRHSSASRNTTFYQNSQYTYELLPLVLHNSG